MLILTVVMALLLLMSNNEINRGGISGYITEKVLFRKWNVLDGVVQECFNIVLLYWRIAFRCGWMRITFSVKNYDSRGYGIYFMKSNYCLYM